MKAIAFGGGVFLAYAGWVNLPHLNHGAVSASVVVVLVLLVCAYLGGREHGRRRATASALSMATAQAAAQATGGNAAASTDARQLVNVNVYGGRETVRAREPGGSRGRARLPSGGVILGPESSDRDPAEVPASSSERRLPWLSDDPALRLVDALEDGGALEDGSAERG